MAAPSSTSPAPYPAHWESDVVLMDGGTIHIRPIRPDDADALVAFHEGLSPETVYLRFFSAHPHLSPNEVERFTNVDYDRRLALVAELDGELVAVGRYDHIQGTSGAEVAFVVADRHHGRGIATVLLEDLAAVARELGITRFHADTLAHNYAMQRIFREAGFTVVEHMDSGVVRVEFAIEPTEQWRAAVEIREHRAEARSIARVLNPRSIAVVGASRQATASVGRQVLRNLADAGFEGAIHPIHPSADSIDGRRAFPSVLDVPDEIDLAIVAVAPAAVLTTAEQCGRKGVAGMVVLSAGFSEMGTGGADLEARLHRIARRYGMRVIGPNCIGVVNTAVGLDATFASYRPLPGAVAMQSQSGAVGIALLEFASRIGLGVSSFVSVGNKVDVSGNDLLQYWEDDPDTDVILLYLESFGNPRKFARLARRVARRKPIVAVKSGRTEAGSRAASSHTAAMASADAAVDALFHQAGVIRVDRIDELFDMAVVLVGQPLPGGPRVAIVGNSGGPGVLATDACVPAGLELAELSDVTRARLREIADTNASVGNPIDLVASATPDVFEAAITAVLADPHVDAVVTITTPTLFAPPDLVADALRRAAGSADKPVLASFLAWPDMPALLRGGDGRDVPAFSSPEPAVAALGRAARYGAWRRRDPGTVPTLDDIDAVRARRVVERALAAEPDGGWLDPAQAAELLDAYGIAVSPTRVAGDGAGAVAAADAVGYPVVVKAAGPDLVHKTDVGGVALNLAGPEEVEAAVAVMQHQLGPRATGFAVQPMAEAGIELIVGVVQDPRFGPLVMLGMGGVTAELLGDRAFRILPVTGTDAAELVRSLRCSPLLFGYRGRPPVAADRLEELLVRVGRLAGDVPALAELDLNPMIATPDCVIAVDAKVRIAPVPAAPPTGIRRLG